MESKDVFEFRERANAARANAAGGRNEGWASLYHEDVSALCDEIEKVHRQLTDIDREQTTLVNEVRIERERRETIGKRIRDLTRNIDLLLDTDKWTV